MTSNLSQVQGQPEALSFLKRVADGNPIPPLLLVGPEGVGKKYSAYQAIKDYWKEGHTKQLEKGIHPDFCLVSSEKGKDIGVDEIRSLVDWTSIYPVATPTKFVIIDGADTLTVAAANALLKTVEEPLDTVRFFLIAQDLNRVIPTIRSRCGLVRYGRLGEEFIVKSLKKFEPDLLKSTVYARLSGGSVGRAIKYWGASRLSLRDTMWNLLIGSQRGDLSVLFGLVDEIKGDGDLELGITFFEHLLYDLNMAPYNLSALVNLDLAESISRFRSVIGEGRLRKLVSGLSEVRSHMRAKGISLPFHFKAYLALAFSG